MSVELVLLRSRTPAVEKQKINGCRTSAPAVPQSRSPAVQSRSGKNEY